MRVIAVVLLLVMLGSVSYAAQAPVPAAPPPAFEVAAVKRNQTTATTGEAAAWSFQVSPSGIVAITNYSLRRLIVVAYGIEQRYERHTPEGGPASLLATRFDITAKVPVDPATTQPPGAQAPTVRATALLMLRTLLSERFKLRIHSETRQVPVYAVTVARDGRLGPELRPSSHDCERFRAARREGSAAEPPRDAKNRPLCTLEVLRSSTSTNPQGTRQIVAQQERNAGPLTRLLPGIQAFVDRPLVDETGLAGNFEWQITTAMPGIDAFEYPSIRTALEEQLGLKVESRTATIDVIVIDSVEFPTPD
jgi:uncharacterized protein (TIGR03435 family)